MSELGTVFVAVGDSGRIEVYVHHEPTTEHQVVRYYRTVLGGRWSAKLAVCQSCESGEQAADLDRFRDPICQSCIDRMAAVGRKP